MDLLSYFHIYIFCSSFLISPIFFLYFWVDIIASDNEYEVYKQYLAIIRAQVGSKDYQLQQNLPGFDIKRDCFFFGQNQSKRK